MHPTLFALKRAYLAARHVLEGELHGSVLTVAHLDVIKHLLPAASGVDQRALQEALGVTSATLTRLLAGMEKHELVVRRPHRTDARGKTVAVTPKARAMFETLIAEVEGPYNERLLRGFTEAETLELTRLLGKIADNMGGSSESG